MSTEDLEAIEEAYDTRIGPDATTVRRLVDALRKAMDELEAIDFALAGGFVGEECVRAATIMRLMEER